MPDIGIIEVTFNGETPDFQSFFFFGWGGGCGHEGGLEDELTVQCGRFCANSHE